ncbi:hypothetical protein R3I94_016665 [Phoxinus phoxinus]
MWRPSGQRRAGSAESFSFVFVESSSCVSSEICLIQPGYRDKHTLNYLQSHDVWDIFEFEVSVFVD